MERVAQPGPPVVMVHLAGLATRAVDLVAMAPPDPRCPKKPPSAVAFVVRTGHDRLHLGNAQRRPIFAIGTARAGHLGCLRASDAQTRRQRRDRLVHAAVLLRLRHHRLGDLDCHANRRSQSASRQRGATRPWFRTPLLRTVFCPGGAGHAGVGLAGEMARRPPSRCHLEELGSAGWRRRAVLGAGDDLVAASAGLCPQLRAPGTANQRYRARCPMRRSAGFEPGADRRLAVSQPTGSAACANRCGLPVVARQWRGHREGEHSVDPARWTLHSVVKRPTDRTENIRIYGRSPGTAPDQAASG